MFSKGVGVKNSYEVTVLAILATLRISSRLFQVNLIVKSDSHNAILWET